MNTTFPALDKVALPARIERLQELSYNLWLSWHEEAQELYKTLDQLLWEKTGHNPIAFLRRIDPCKLEEHANDVSYLASYNRVFRAYDVYMNESDTWFSVHYPTLRNHTIAYFSTEFGIHESLPLYAGGLGILSGDHSKEASDLGLPFVGVGLLYHKGYFTQKIGADGWQEDVYREFDPYDRPIRPVCLSDNNTPTRITITLGSLEITSLLWKIQVGRVPVYLLDTQLESNDPGKTEDIQRLYGGAQLTRLLQEILLGIGGVRALRLLGITPQAWHMNEGHSAFLTMELLRENIEKNNIPFEQAAEQTSKNIIFTTHTPVPAGLDMFDQDLMAEYFDGYWKSVGVTREQFLALGRQDIGWGEKFSMPRLALRLSSLRNGVSKLHGQVSRELFQNVWPDRTVEDVPIFHITNGVHAETWVAPELAELFRQYVGQDWLQYMDDPALWTAIDAIPDDILWETRQKLKLTLLRFLRHQAQVRWEQGESTPTHIAWSGALFNHETLTIGFARRFATYKRATLLFHDLQRLARLLRDSDHPVQIVFSGKAHPQDHGGKALIQSICHYALDPQMAARIAFLEDYDMNVSRYLVRGVDVWLNTPRRPREASGTSGQKAALNGVPNLSVLDGWWAEGYNGCNGWPIGNELISWVEDEEDRLDADALYRTLEEEVIPSYYTRTEKGIPHTWLHKVREAIKSAIPYFTTRRMLKEYTQKMYVPGIRTQALTKKSND